MTLAIATDPLLTLSCLPADIANINHGYLGEGPESLEWLLDEWLAEMEGINAVPTHLGRVVMAGVDHEVDRPTTCPACGGRALYVDDEASRGCRICVGLGVVTGDEWIVKPTPAAIRDYDLRRPSGKRP